MTIRLFFRFTKDLAKEYKYTLGESIKKEILVLPRISCVASMFQRRGGKVVLRKNYSVFLSGLLIFISAFCLLFPAHQARAMGLEVDPNEIVVKDCRAGRKLAVSKLKPEGAKLQIYNKSAYGFTYTITPFYCLEVNAPLKKGYSDIPDTSWIIPKNKEIFIKAGETKEVELYLKIPKHKEYRNKKYQAIIEIKSKKNKPKDIFVLAVQLKMLFSTK